MKLNPWLIIDPAYLEPRIAKKFEDIPKIIQLDLIKYTDPFRDPFHKDYLLKLYKTQKFMAWDCPMCILQKEENRELGVRHLYSADIIPDEWRRYYTNVNYVTQDFDSYPVNESGIYKVDFLYACCDSCRAASWSCVDLNVANRGSI